MKQLDNTWHTACAHFWWLHRRICPLGRFYETRLLTPDHRCTLSELSMSLPQLISMSMPILWHCYYFDGSAMALPWYCHGVYGTVIGFYGSAMGFYSPAMGLAPAMALPWENCHDTVTTQSWQYNVKVSTRCWDLESSSAHDNAISCDISHISLFSVC